VQARKKGEEAGVRSRQRVCVCFLITGFDLCGDCIRWGFGLFSARAFKLGVQSVVLFQVYLERKCFEADLPNPCLTACIQAVTFQTNQASPARTPFLINIELDNPLPRRLWAMAEDHHLLKNPGEKLERERENEIDTETGMTSERDRHPGTDTVLFPVLSLSSS
jgi:hypothetical protein